MKRKKLYTSSGEILYEDDVRSLFLLGSGQFGSVYWTGEDKVIKLLDDPDTIVQYDTIKTIQSLKLPNVYHIFDILSREKIGLKKYAGIITSYHKPENIDIWTMPSSWLIENYENIRETAIKLGEHNIAMVDAFEDNVILNSDGITIIDTDFYWNDFNNEVEYNLDSINTYLFYRLLAFNYQLFHDKVPVEDALQEFFFQDVESSRKKDFVKTLSRYDKPIDYLKDRFS